MKQCLVITELTSTFGYGRKFRAVHRRQELVDYFPFPLTPACFIAECSDYDTIPNRIGCPCGRSLEWSGVIGDAMEVVADHIREHRS